MAAEASSMAARSASRLSISAAALETADAVSGCVADTAGAGEVVGEAVSFSEPQEASTKTEPRVRSAATAARGSR